MEDILKALNIIKNELDEQRQEIRENGKNVTEKVTQNISRILEEKFIEMDKKHEILNERLENQEKRLHILERQARKTNLVFFGIEENENSYEILERNIISWVGQNLSLKLTCNDIQEVKRIGKKEDKIRPIVVTFSTLGIKIKILKQKRILRGTQYNVMEDYPKHVLEKRKELQKQLQLEREKGNMATIKYDRLIISKTNAKRKLSTSPENTTTSNIEIKTQKSKKNRVQQINTRVKRSSSFSEGVIKQGMLNYVTKNTAFTNKTQNNQA